MVAVESSTIHYDMYFTEYEISLMPDNEQVNLTLKPSSLLELETKVIRRFLKISQSPRRPLLYDDATFVSRSSCHCHDVSPGRVRMFSGW